MFFDDATPKKASMKPKLRLAGDVYGRENALNSNDTRAPSARQRLEYARYKNENATSLLDRIDAIGRNEEIARDAPKMELPNDHNAVPIHDASKDHFSQIGYEQTTAPDLRGRPAPANEFGTTAPLVHPIYVINAIKKWRNVILATTILGGVIGTLIALNTPKLYYSSTGIIIDPRNFKVVENDINPDVFLSEASLAIVDSQLNIIRSPTVMDQVVGQLSLEKDAEFNGSKKGLLSPLLGFLEILSGGKSEGSNVGTAIKNVNKMTEAKRLPGTFVINIGATSEDPERAAQIANTIVDVYLAERATDRSNTADRTSNSMQARLPELKKQVEIAENKAAKFKAENDLFDAQGRLIDDEVILRLNDQLSSARSTTITLNARADSAKSVTVDGLLAGGLPEEINSNALNSLRAQYTTSKQRYDGLLTKLGPMHPDLQQAANESGSLRASIDAEITRIRSSIQTDLRRAVQTEQSLAASLAQMKVKLAESGDALVKLREIEREAASARTVYEQFLLRAQETSEQGTIDSTNVKRTNLAKASREPVNTSRKLLVMAGIVGGFLLGLGLAILVGILDALKVQYGGNHYAGGPQSSPPQPSSRPTKRSIRGVFEANVSENARQPIVQETQANNGAYAQNAAMRTVEAQQERAQTKAIDAPAIPVEPTQPLAPAPMVPTFAAAMAPQPQFVAMPMPQPMPMYAQQQPIFIPQMQQPWFFPQQQMIPQMMAPQQIWQPQPQHMISPVAPVAQSNPVAPVAEQPIVHAARRNTTPQNTQMDDIQESLADMKAELLSMVRQRRHG
jgi:polysaccharide biosynthesis transport protein